jgi:ATP-dependent DNA helicase RecG
MPEKQKRTSSIPLRSAPANYLDSPVEDLPQVAAKRLSCLHKLDIYTVYDVVTYFPRAYENWSRILPIDDLKDKEEASFIAVVRQKASLQRKGRLSILRSVLSDGSGTIRAVWFNQPYLMNRLVKNESYFFPGKDTP